MNFVSPMSMLNLIKWSSISCQISILQNKTNELKFLVHLQVVDIGEQEIDLNMVFFIIEKRFK